jgi:hypothetical protein
MRRRGNGLGTPRAFWLCRCDCGIERFFEGSKLKRGRTCSCGCAARAALLAPARLPRYGAGIEKDPAIKRTYSSWSSMKDRCTNPKNVGWHNYGGRGITVCARWLKDFGVFLSDMGLRPEGLTLGRIDNSGNYEPKNCSWQTRMEQANNTRVNRVLPNGETVAQMCLRLGLDATIIIGRLNMGWSLEDAVSKPLRWKWRSSGKR